jgi:hypothetical protein
MWRSGAATAGAGCPGDGIFSHVVMRRVSQPHNNAPVWNDAGEGGGRNLLVHIGWVSFESGRIFMAALLFPKYITPMCCLYDTKAVGDVPRNDVAGEILECPLFPVWKIRHAGMAESVWQKPGMGVKADKSLTGKWKMQSNSGFTI